MQKKFLVKIVSENEEQLFNTSKFTFPEAASWAHIQSLRLTERTKHNWRVISISEV